MFTDDQLNRIATIERERRMLDSEIETLNKDMEFKIKEHKKLCDAILDIKFESLSK